MIMDDEAQISIIEKNGETIITGSGSLTFMNATKFGDELKQASLNADRVTVDLRSAVFIDSQIVQDLGRAAVALTKRGKRLRALFLETAYPLQVLKIVGFEEIMDVEVE